MRRQIALVLFSLAALLTVPLLLFGIVLLLALGLAAAGGLLWGAGCLLFLRYRMGLESLAIGAAAFVALVILWDRIFAARDMARRCGLIGPAPIRASSLRIDFRK